MNCKTKIDDSQDGCTFAQTTQRLFKKFTKITQMQKNIEHAHVNKAQTLVCPIRHALKKYTKAINIKMTFNLSYRGVWSCISC